MNNSGFSDTEGLTVSAIVPVNNGGSRFVACLGSLRACDPPPLEVIVVADGDAHGSDGIAEGFGFDVVKLRKQRGPAYARNFGAKTARGDVLLFLDADVAVSKDLFGCVRGMFETHPEISAVIGSYDDEPAEMNFLSQYKNLFHHYVHQHSNPEASTFWTGCGAIRRNIFLEAGGFNESYTRPCIEDIELGCRLKSAGFRIRLCKNLQVKHLKRWGFMSLLKTDFFDRALPWTMLILNRRSFINDLNVTRSSRLSVIVAYVFLLTGFGAPFLSWKMLPLTCICAVVVLLVNLNLYRFFNKRRGLWFTVPAVAWHWFYFLYSGLAFALGVVRWQAKKNAPSKIDIS